MAPPPPRPRPAGAPPPPQLHPTSRHDGTEPLPRLTVCGPGDWLPPPAGLPAFRTRGYPDHPERRRPASSAPQRRAPTQAAASSWEAAGPWGRSRALAGVPAGENADWRSLPPLRTFPEDDGLLQGHDPLPSFIELAKAADAIGPRDVAICTGDNGRRIAPMVALAREVNRSQMDEPRDKLLPPTQQTQQQQQQQAAAGGPMAQPAGYPGAYQYAPPEAFGGYAHYPVAHGHPPAETYPVAMVDAPATGYPTPATGYPAPATGYPVPAAYPAAGYPGAQQPAGYPQGYAPAVDPRLAQYAPAQYGAGAEPAPRR